MIASSSAFCDRIMFLPAGRKISENSFRLDVLTTPSRDRAYGWFTYSPNRTYEFEVYGENLNTDRLDLGFNMSYSITNPITDLAPGIRFGFLDGFNQTDEGRTIYGAITYRLGNDGELNQFLPTDLTIGIWSRKESLMYVAAELPFSATLSVMGEMDARNISGGFKVSPVPGASFQLIFRNGDPTFGLSVRKQF